MGPTPHGTFPRPGHRWAHFDVTGEVARGNMGVVFRARDVRDARDVALKVLIVGHDDREACERFKREARSLARLSHRHIVRVHSYGVHEGIPFLTMDFVPGTTLQALLEGGGLPLNRAVDLLACIARAMDHAHSRGVLHRDLKPSNVLIGADGEPRITDFGLARLDDASGSLTQDGDLIGTPVFMAPEQIRGDVRALGACTDVWALGVTLYLTLTGSLPFRGKTVDEVSQRVLHEEPRPPRAVRPELPEDLERVCLAALRKDWRARYQSAGELARDLDAYLRGRPVLAGRVTAAVRGRRLLRSARLHAPALALALGAVVLACGVGLGLHLQRASGLQRRAEELRVRSEQRRAAARVAVEAADAAWAQGALPVAAEQARHALEEVAWAAAYLDRSTRVEDGAPATEGTDPTLRLEAALGRPPAADELARGVARDPALAELRTRGRALEARVIELTGGPGDGRSDDGSALVEGFRATRDLADLEVLVAAAERTGSLVTARRARDALAEQGLGPASVAGHPAAARLLALLERLAALGAPASCAPCAAAPVARSGGPPAPRPASGQAAWTCPACGHACAAAPPGGCGSCGVDAAHAANDGAPGEATRLALARAALRRADPAAALAHLARGQPGPGEGLERALLRATAARRAGRAEEHLAALAPLLSPADGVAVDARAWLERARGLLDEGWPRGARDTAAHITDAPRADLRAAARLLQGEAALALGEPDRVLAALVEDARAPLTVRLEALRLRVLAAEEDALPVSEPDAGAPEPTEPLTRARRRLRLARLAHAVEGALSRVALDREGLGRLAPASAAAERPGRGRLDLPGAQDDAVRLDEPAALAAVAVLCLAAGDSARAEALARAARDAPGGASCRAAATAARLVGLPAAGPPADQPLPAGDAGAVAPLAEGRAWLGEEGVAAPDDAGGPPRERALRALDLAVRRDPFAAGPRLARSALALRRAADEPTADGRRERCREALADAAVARLLDREDGAPVVALLTALACVRPAALVERLPAAGPALTPGERRALERATDPRALIDQGATPDDPDSFVALRLAVTIVRARADDHGLRPPEEVAVAEALRRRLDRLPAAGLAPSLLRAALVLEEPDELDGWLTHRSVTAGEEELTQALGGEHALAARTLRILWTLSRVAPGAPREVLAAHRARALEDLEAIARRRPGRAVTALRAAVEVWTGAPGPASTDLLERPWTGALREVLAAPTGKAAAPRLGALFSHPAVRRYLGAH